MKYEKPQIVVLPSAAHAINSCESSKTSNVKESNSCGNNGTSSAYEADE
jgi:hypothetical protein